MGCCLSKTTPSPPSLSPVKPQNSQPKNEPREPQNLPTQMTNESKKKSEVAETEKKKENRLEKEEEEEKLGLKNKEVIVIQHRKSHDKRSEGKGSSLDSDGLVQSTNSSEPESRNPKNPVNEGIASNGMAMAGNGAPLRTSSCTKEEVDAILIQCGRLSRSPARKCGGSAVSGSGRKYSGSKRSHDFDRENDVSTEQLNCDGGVADDDKRQRRRQPSGSHCRRTPSRSRERDPQAQRSGSRERAGGSGCSGGSGRRVSRSPGRRSESPINGGGSATNSNACRIGKMVTVPASVSSLSMEKSNNGGNGDGATKTGNVKRVLVKRNMGEAPAGSRTATPPRSRSPARSSVVGGNGMKGTKEGNIGEGLAGSRSATSPRTRSPARSSVVGGLKGSINQQNQPSLSRNSSRKAEHSPYRRTPLTDLDMNSLPFQPLANKSSSVKGQQKSKEIDEEVVVKQPVGVASQSKLGAVANTAKGALQGAHRRTRSRGGEGSDLAHVNYCKVTENRSQMNAEQLALDKREQLNTSGYDALVSPVILSGSDTLQLPPTLTRSRSSRRSRDLDINVESLLNPNPATDYNSLLLQDIKNFHQKTNASMSLPFALPECVSKACSIVEAVADLNSSTSSNPFGIRKGMEKPNDPFVESEVNPGDDLMEPSLQKYVTIRKRDTGVESTQCGDSEEQESSGSNSFVAGIQNRWVSSSSWEPNSADSSDCWTSKSREERVSPVSFQRVAIE